MRHVLQSSTAIGTADVVKVVFVFCMATRDVSLHYMCLHITYDLVEDITAVQASLYTLFCIHVADYGQSISTYIFVMYMIVVKSLAHHCNTTHLYNEYDTSLSHSSMKQLFVGARPDQTLLRGTITIFSAILSRD